MVPNTIRQTFAQAKAAALTESDAVILDTETTMMELWDHLTSTEDSDSAQRMLTASAHKLRDVWRAGTEQVDFETSNGMTSQFGAPIQKAYYLGSLILALHHPPSKLDVSGNLRGAQESNAVIDSSMSMPLPFPQLLLDWLDAFHTSHTPLLQAIQSAEPNCTSHKLYWDIVQSLVLRGKLREVISLFNDSDFRYAVSALEDGSSKPGYAGAQLQAVQGIINRACQLLSACPGTKDANWEVDDRDWGMYRQRVFAELRYLTQLSEEPDDDDMFEAENFGIRRSKPGSLVNSLGSSSGNLPPTILESLKCIYKIILGSAEHIMAQSQEWLEATTALTIWWDGSEDSRISAWNRNVGQSQGAIPQDPFLTRLRTSFLCVTDPESVESFPISNISPSELGVAAIFQGDLEGALLITKTLSLCITSALAELGIQVGWLSAANNPSMGLEEEDLIVLNYNKSGDVNKDDILAMYAEEVFKRDDFQEEGYDVEGWEIALSVCSRISDHNKLKSEITHFIDALQLNDQNRMDKLVNICGVLGLEEESRTVAEKYADHLVQTSTSYGLAMVYYARSHNAGRVRQLIDLLNSYCLVQSQAYPRENDLDAELQAMVFSPKNAFRDLGKSDPEAAEILRFSFVGYACLRRFYGLRDEQIAASKTPNRPAHKPLARRRLALKALLAAINSAADSIYGGLYDPERQSAIQVDCLLPLLGEATSFIATTDKDAILTAEHMYALLAAIEDLQTVNTRVYDATEECLQASLRNFHGSLPPSPHAMLKKSVSSGTNSNFSFSLMGSEMMTGSGDSAGGKSLGSMVLVGGSKGGDDRGWDWRERFKDQGVTGVDVLRYLREGIAKELSMRMLEDN